MYRTRVDPFRRHLADPSEFAHLMGAVAEVLTPSARAKRPENRREQIADFSHLDPPKAVKKRASPKGPPADFSHLMNTRFPGER